jgi:DNA-binding transcriptional ArsR family regulator
MPSRSSRSSLATLAKRLEALERAVSRPAAAAPDSERYWLVGRMQAEPAPGAVAYGGSVTTPRGEHYVWQKQARAADLYRFDWTSVEAVLIGLGHPVRLAILKAVLEGRGTAAELQRVEGLGTTGQLYHHLKILERGGWVRSLERGRYGVPGERVVPLLTILAACAG